MRADALAIDDAQADSMMVVVSFVVVCGGYFRFDTI